MKETQEIQNIRSLLKDSPQAGIAQLINYADKQTVYFVNDTDPGKSTAMKTARQFYFNAVFYGNEYNRAATDEEKEKFLQEMLGLLAGIEEQSTEGESLRSDIEEKKEEKRSLFINQGMRKDIVFESRGIYKTYPSTEFTLDNINMVCRRGEITGLVGGNGNGKTTLLKIMAGITAPDKGKGMYNYGVLQKQGTKVIPWTTVKKNIAYLPQQLDRLYGDVETNLKFFAAVHGFKAGVNDYELNYIIHRLDLTRWRTARIEDLSGGTRLRLALARILLRKPKFLILDEPLASLDINAVNLLLNDLRDLAKSFTEPISVILSSQHLEEVESVSDNMIILAKGKIVYSGTTSNIGGLRRENVFEIKTSLSKEEITRRMEGFSFVKIEHTGFSFMITTALDRSLQELMQYLVKYDIPVTHITDISNSTKKWMLHTKG